METKHTKGEWHLVTAFKNNSTVKHDALGIANQKKSNGAEGLICLISPIDFITEEDEANAKLIAAAPDLLEACILAKNQLLEAGFNEKSNTVLTIEAAISKATQ